MGRIVCVVEGLNRRGEPLMRILALQNVTDLLGKLAASNRLEESVYAPQVAVVSCGAGKSSFLPCPCIDLGLADTNVGAHS